MPLQQAFPGMAQHEARQKHIVELKTALSVHFPRLGLDLSLIHI